MELEQEFAAEVVGRKIIDYLRTREPDEVNLSGAFYESPEDRAEKIMKDLTTNNLPKLERLYVAACAELA